MPERDAPSAAATGALERESTRLVESIEQDFTALVDVFERQLKLISQSDPESRACIVKAKEAAQRGVSLSRQLSELTRQT